MAWSCKYLRWDKVNRIPSVVQYRIVFSFHLAKRINPPDPGWDRKERYCPLFGKRLLGVKLIRREQNSRWTFTQAKTSFICGVKTGSMLVCWPCDCTSGNLNKTSVREKPRVVYLPIGFLFFRVIWWYFAMLNVTRLCVVTDVLWQFVIIIALCNTCRNL